LGVFGFPGRAFGVVRLLCRLRLLGGAVMIALPQVAHKSNKKLCAGSFAVSFGESGGRYCDDECRHKCGSCYFMRLQTARPNVRSSMQRVEDLGPVATIRAAIATMPRRFSWMRWSVSAGVPMREDFATVESWREFRREFRRANQQAIESGADVHLPTESARKARILRRMLSGLGVVVRRSVQSARVSDLLRARDHRAFTVYASGHKVTAGPVGKLQKRSNIAAAHDLARQVRAAGSSCVVCPFSSSGRLCGDCRACASDRVDVVLFPGS